MIPDDNKVLYCARCSKELHAESYKKTDAPYELKYNYDESPFTAVACPKEESTYLCRGCSDLLREFMTKVPD